MSSITGTYEILTRANKFWKQSGKKELYKIELAGVSEKVEYCLELNLNEKISVEHLSAGLAVGRRNFDRRFIKATGNTPVEYSQRVKIESAKKALETSRKTINEVMYEVGYADVKAFREVFRKITGMSPLEYRSKYNKEAVV